MGNSENGEKCNDFIHHFEYVRRNVFKTTIFLWAKEASDFGSVFWIFFCRKSGTFADDVFVKGIRKSIFFRARIYRPVSLLYSNCLSGIWIYLLRHFMSPLIQVCNVQQIFSKLDFMFSEQDLHRRGNEQPLLFYYTTYIATSRLFFIFPPLRYINMLAPAR